MKNTKQEKGITLIALVITIIVMLILVSVTITMAINGGLFNYAQKAKVDTEAKMAEENDLAKGLVTVDGKEQMDINAIVESYKTGENPPEVKTVILHYSFSVDGGAEGEIELEVEEGTTWGEWIESSYAEDALETLRSELYEASINQGIADSLRYAVGEGDLYPDNVGVLFEFNTSTCAAYMYLGSSAQKADTIINCEQEYRLEDI